MSGYPMQDPLQTQQQPQVGNAPLQSAQAGPIGPCRTPHTDRAIPAGRADSPCSHYRRQPRIRAALCGAF
jgi:hypothetical protein